MRANVESNVIRTSKRENGLSVWEKKRPKSNTTSDWLSHTD